MKSKLFTAALVVIASFCVSQSASAFVATTGLDPATNDSGGSLAVGSEYSVKGGTFSFYDPGTDGPTPTGDLSDYRYKASGTITSTDPATDTATFDGKYRVFYDENGNGKYNPNVDTSVSFGDVALTLTLGANGTGTVTGTLTQIDGPSNGAAGFSGSAAVTGFFQVIDANNDAEYIVTISSIPEPSTWAAMLSGAGLLLGTARFRKRA